MRFSIIVPVYNVESYIYECLQSILNQEYNNYELILVDDGSKDNSGLICDQLIAEYKKINIKVIHKQNGGLSDARNAGLQVARGEYIVFVDSDDMITEESLMSLDKAIVDSNYPEVLITRIIEWYKNGTKKTLDSNLNFCFEKNRDNIIERLCYLSKSFCPAQRYIVKRTLISNKKLLFKKGFYHEDLDWTTNLLLEGESFADFNHPWYFHRMNRIGSITNSPSIGFKRIKDVLLIASEGVKRVESSTLSENAKKALCIRITESVFSILSLYNNCNETDKHEVVKQLRNCSNVFKYTKRIPHVLFVKVSLILGFKFGLMLKQTLHRG